VAYEKYIEKITGDLSQAQRELIESQQQLQNERKQLSEFHKKLKERWQREFDSERQRLQKVEEELDNESCNLSEEQNELEQRARQVLQEQLRTNADYELKRRNLREAWLRVREAQQQWRKRRSEERAALRVRALDVERCELGVHKLRQSVQQQAQAWEQQRARLQQEVEGLQNRVKNQRHTLFDQQREIERLQTQAREQADKPAGTAAPAPQPEVRDETLEKRRAELDQRAAELADQRLHLAEQWQRLLGTQQRFRQDQLKVLDAVESIVGQLACQEEEIGQREQLRQEAENNLRLKHEEMLQLRQHLVGWRARLRVQETAWEGKRNQVLAEVRTREELAENQLQALVEIRQRWGKRRRKEIEQLRNERQALEKQRREHVAMQQQLEARMTRVEDERRSLAEKAIAFEQYRQQFLSRGGENPAAERRIERLRRRWVSQNANIVRVMLRERENLQAESATLDEKYAALQKQADHLASQEANLVEKQTAWEHKQILAASRHARMQQEVQKALNQHAATESQLGKMQDEVERIAKTLLEEPEPPAILRDAA
jgi:chromosome segregation ATPase